ncbi:hypothetical protein GCM10010862_23610 [Devosia nitrariae]|uniref:Uncharacterized protein n=1 Tax=Devosia nitrariae TaxID=2071872 RepID=A0ABQ5W5G9_9HYPH|nr:hypothetical protein GCM10010862_23610 [Devosia nitrariae]
MHVLEDEYGGAPDVLERVQERREEPLGGGRLVEQRGHALIELMSHILERSQRTRREKWFAPAPKHPAIRPGLFRESTKERRFADARLAFDQYGPTMPGHSLPRRRQQSLNWSVPFKQHETSRPQTL